MPATGLRSPRLLDAAWAAVASACLAVMIAWPAWEAIPFHLIWVTLTILYGYRVWTKGTTSLVLAVVILATGISIAFDAMTGSQGWDELGEVPLLAAMFAAMVWHAQRRRRALATASALAEQRAKTLEQEERLLHDVSHELRTPVTIARLHLELLERELGARPRPLSIAFDELERIETIVERLLLLARVEGDEPMATHPIALLPFLEDVFMRWVELAPRAWHLGSVADVTIVVDEALLRTALDALLENAVQYTDDYVRIALSAWGDRNELVISVADEGVGVDPAARERIFQRFARTDESRSRRAGGVGLGLATAAAIARVHGGSCRLSPSPKGATFELRLPLSQAGHADTEHAAGTFAAPAAA
jgi:two-component system, OmpR family, sensor kinase